MMKKSDIKTIKEAFNPSEELVDKVSKRAKEQRMTFRRSGLRLSVSMMVVVAMVLIYQQIIPGNRPIDGGVETQTITGLPIDTSLLVSDRLNDSNSKTEDSLAYVIETIDDWFRHEMEAIVIARVVELREPNETEFSIITPVTLEILQSVKGDLKGQIKAFDVGLSSSTMYYETYPKTDLRVGGVYVLPLYMGESGWTLSYTTFVLFEIDDMGNLNSHTAFEGLNKYDGKPYTTLIEDLNKRLNDATFMLTSSAFGQAFEMFELIQGTVLHIELPEASNASRTFVTIEIKDSFTNHVFDDVIVVQYYDKSTILQEGDDVILFVNLYKGYEGNDAWSAQIDAQQTIHSGGIYFDQFDGFTYQSVLDAIYQLKP